MKEARRLSFFCQDDDNRSVVKLLKQYPNLDLTRENGICFKFAIKHKNLDMLNTLLDYYEKTKLQGDHDSMEYKVASYKLRQILHEAIDSFEVSSGIQESLDPYITTTEDSDNEQDLVNFEEGGLMGDIPTDLVIIGDVSGDV